MDEPPSQLLLEVLSGFSLVHGIGFLWIVLLLIASGLISASEVAFFSLTAEQIDTFRKQKDSTSAIVVRLLEKPRRLLATILIMNNLVNVAIVTIATFLMWELTGTHSPEEVIVAGVTLGVTFAITFFGEIVPKVYATKHNVSFARFMAMFWRVLVLLCRPLSSVLLSASNVIEKRFEKKGYHTTVQELNQALDIVTEYEETSKDEKDILKGIVNFGTLSVRQIMISRMDLAAVDIESDFHELMDFINKSGFSRLPVYRDTLDNIEGIVYIKDLLPYIDNDEHFEWQKLMRPGFFVPETKKIDSLLKDFQGRRVHMAIVVDEYGGTSGLITLEDVIEEIIGEINDEFDDEELKFRKIDDRTFVFEGKVSIHDLCKAMELPENTFDEVKGDSESLGGLILELNQTLPKAGQQVTYKDYTFTIESADKRRIKRVRVFKSDVPRESNQHT